LENIHLREGLQKVTNTVRASASGCSLIFFDVFDSEARRVLSELPLDGQGIGADDPRTVHLVIVGFGRMGRSLALRAAKMGHFANGKLLRISVIDGQAERQRKQFLFRYPALEFDKICRLTFHQADAQSLTTRRLIEGWAAEPDTLLHLFVCVDDNASALEVGLQLQEALVRRPDCNLLIQIKNRASLTRILEQAQAPGPRIAVFGMLEDTCCDSVFRHEFNERIARSLHEEFVKKRLAASNRTLENDLAMRPWDQFPEELRESIRQQTDHLAIKLQAIDCIVMENTDPRQAVTQFKPEEIEMLAELEHTRWNVERLLANWEHGPTNQKVERISPHLAPWRALDESIKKYDRDAVTDIPKRLAAAQMKVVRRKQTNTG
jgi:hypothetical protein